jgi:hypothetical protein
MAEERKLPFGITSVMPSTAQVDAADSTPMKQPTIEPTDKMTLERMD